MLSPRAKHSAKNEQKDADQIPVRVRKRRNSEKKIQMLPLVLAKAASKPSRRLISWILSLSIIGSKIAQKENAIE